MEKVAFPQIVGPTYTLSSLNAECQRCVNFQIEQIESGDSFYMKETPGLVEFFNVDDGVPHPDGDPSLSNLIISNKRIQGLHKCANGRVFFILRYVLYEIFADGSLTVRGRLLNALSDLRADKFAMQDNATTLLIVRDFTGWEGVGNFPGTFDQDLAFLTFDTNVFNGLVGGLDFGGTKFLGFIDQYIISPVLNDQGAFGASGLSRLVTQFQISPLNVEALQSWDAADVFGVESSPDYLISQVVNGRELWQFGQESYEVFYNSPDPSVRFTRVNDVSFKIGCGAAFSALSFLGKVIWLGSAKEGSYSVFMSDGYQPVKISNTGIEQLIKSYGTVEDAIAWTYTLPGHNVYVLTFPTANKTLAYDLSTGSWNEREYRDPDTQEIGRHRGEVSIHAFGKNLVGDYERGIIYELKDDVYTDNGAPIVRYRRAPVISAGKKVTFFHSLELNMQVGVGYQDAPIAYEPKISLRFSDNNANTWKSYYTRSMGKVGEFNKTVPYNRLGATRQGRVFELYTNEPVPVRIMSAELGLSFGVH